MPDLSLGHIALIVFGGIGLLGAWYFLQDHRRAARLRAAARELGLDYRGTDRQFHQAHLAAAPGFSGEGTYLVKNLMVGQLGGRAVRVFDLNVISRDLVQQTVIGLHGVSGFGGVEHLVTTTAGDWGYCYFPGTLLTAPQVTNLLKGLTASDAPPPPPGGGFAGAWEAMYEPHEPPQPRLLHYLFAHRVLWDKVFEDFDFAPSLVAPGGGQAVGSLWRSLVAEVRASPVAAASRWRMPPAVAGRLPSGMDDAGDEPQLSSVVEHPLGAIAVVRLPAPRESPEAAYAAVLDSVEMIGEPRCFLWELMDPEGDADGDAAGGADGPRAVLCEWLADGSRRNHGRVGRAGNEGEFVDAVRRQLDAEEERRTAGAPAVHAPARRPDAARDPLDYIMPDATQPAFRHQHCLMAFEAVPRSAAAEPEAWREAIAYSAFGPLLERLWRDAGEEAVRRGRRGNAPADGLAAAADRIAGRPCAIVTLPKPFSPPEAYFAAVFPDGLGSSADGRSGVVVPAVYTLEMTDPLGATPPVVGRPAADGMHAIVGDCDAATLAAFRRALESIAGGGPLRSGSSTLRQLVLYADAHGSPERPR